MFQQDARSPRNDRKNLRFIALRLLAVLALAAGPAAAARAQAGSSVVASAVIVPAQSADLGFINGAIIREINVNEGDFVKAGDTLASLDTPDLEYAMTAAEAGYRSAQSYAQLQRYRTVKKYDRRGRPYFETEPREVVQRGDAFAARAQASLDAARAVLAMSTLTAPFDGTVAALHARAGELAQPDRPILVLATLDRMQAETTDLSERDIAKIKIGQKAVVFIEALGEEFSARVISIAPRADTLGGDVVFKVTLAFDDQPTGLLWGMTAQATFATH